MVILFWSGDIFLNHLVDKISLFIYTNMLSFFGRMRGPINNDAYYIVTYVPQCTQCDPGYSNLIMNEVISDQQRLKLRQRSEPFGTSLKMLSQDEGCRYKKVKYGYWTWISL
jgi:hypothetical protein